MCLSIPEKCSVSLTKPQPICLSLHPPDMANFHLRAMTHTFSSRKNHYTQLTLFLRYFFSQLLKYHTSSQVPSTALATLPQPPVLGFAFSSGSFSFLSALPSMISFIHPSELKQVKAFPLFISYSDRSSKQQIHTANCLPTISTRMSHQQVQL